LLSLICPWHCSHRGTETGAACLSCHLKLQKYPGNGGACQTPLAALLQRCERLQIAGSQKGLSWKAVAHPHLPMARLAQSHRHWRCLLVLPPQTSIVAWKWGVLARLVSQPRSENRTSADSWQPDGASLESYCSASSAHGSARTEPQRLALLACLATSNFTRSLGMCSACQTPLVALLRRCERLQIAGRQKRLAWKAVAQPHLPMALLAQNHRHWRCLLLLPPQTSNIAWQWWVPARLPLQPCSEDANVCR